MYSGAAEYVCVYYDRLCKRHPVSRERNERYNSLCWNSQCERLSLHTVMTVCCICSMIDRHWCPDVNVRLACELVDCMMSKAFGPDQALNGLLVMICVLHYWIALLSIDKKHTDIPSIIFFNKTNTNRNQTNHRTHRATFVQKYTRKKMQITKSVR